MKWNLLLKRKSRPIFMIKIKVPATSANIGVGFDCLGLAVNLYAVVQFEDSSSPLEINGCPKKYQNKNNLIYQAFVAAADFLQQPVPNLKITIDSQVPVSRGLGSSATCIVAGLMGANNWFKANLSQEQLLDLATRIEGHPDNVTPAIYGNMSASFIDDNDDVCSAHFKISSKLHFLALIPDYSISTEKARQILPKEMSYQTAIYQIGHALVLAKALENGDFPLIQKAIIDKMHEPFRKQLIPDYEEVQNICLNENSLCYISGSGSTLMAITDKKDQAQEILKAIKKSFPKWEAHHLQVDTQGAHAIV